MASKDSSSSNSDAKPEPRVVLFGIDLNEIPSSSSGETLPEPTIDAYDVVTSVHGNPRRPFRASCDLTSEVRDLPCVCGRVEARGGVVVCDGCDRWFHLSCAGLRSRQAIVLDDWFCGVCLGNGMRSKRWPLGAVSSKRKRTGVRLLDINASPPSDGEGEESVELQQVQQPGVHTLGENYFSSLSLSAPMTYPTLWYPGTGFDLQRESGTTVHPIKSVPEKIVNCKLPMSRNIEEADVNPTRRGRSRSNNPNTPLKRKEIARLSRINSSTENEGAIRNGCSGEFSSDVEIVDPCVGSFRSSVRVAESRQDGNCGSDSHQLNDGLPVQYEDFYVLCLGKVDPRPSYHNISQLWPVGYRSSWHDMITGSLFICDVLDGGNSGPVFKVRRCPCSTSLIPNASTVLLRPTFGHGDVKEKVESSDAIISDINNVEDTNIQMILSDPCPLEQDLLSCFVGSLNEPCDLQTQDCFSSEGICISEKSGKRSPKYSVLKDEIGEFFAEGRSSSLVWEKVSNMLVDACFEAYNRSGSLQFYCKHETNGSRSSCSGFVDANNKDGHSSLAKFCSSSGPVQSLRVIRSNLELTSLCAELKHWLNEDRFGLDMEFVQEMIERLPGCHACSQYEFLNKRSDYLTMQTVGSGLLLTKRKSGLQGEEEAADGLYRGFKKPRMQDVIQNPGREVHCPPGKPLSLKLPADLVGDVLQVCELLWRFHEVLGLKEPLLFEELEEELLNPWADGINHLEKENQEYRDLTLHKSDAFIGHTGTPTGFSDSKVSEENPPKFIKIETGAAKEAAQVRLASRTYYRCTGVTLTKAHSSLLKVLVGELQAKVASHVDPNFDNGDVKPRRGRKKDADNSISAKRLKIDMLPTNELTWPELARRYVLAVLCMDGNLDSSENISRDGIKVFRCLKGDGGMLCGSPTGVGGMEADALLLAEATKQIFGSLSRVNDVWPLEEKDLSSDAVGACETVAVKDNSVPEWAKVLEPVRKLPTNVGTRIRKCVYEALERDPPEWARKILVHSISKEVYKGNASGPTKKAVLSVLANVSSEGPVQKPTKERKAKSVKTVSDVVMKQCRYVLRRTASADEAKVFSNLLGTTSLNLDNEDEGILGSPGMVSRPLDFRTVDLRLAAGAYGGSHEAFAEDVREVWNNIRTAFGDRSDLLHVAETLSQDFESLYEKEVLTLVQKCREADPQCLTAEVKKELNELICGHEIPKAPWDDGVCKVCGIDKDDESVLLCDTCDSEYHTYCLVPPLVRIPEGNWYCPSCIAGQGKTQDASNRTQVIRQRRRKRYQGEGTRAFSEALTRLGAAMEEKEYWEYSLQERVFLLKFLCDEVLNSAIVREHLDQCVDMSAELQQKLRSMTLELKNLKSKEEILATKATKENMVLLNGAGETGREGMATLLTNYGKWAGLRQSVNNRYNHCAANDVPEENELHDPNKSSCWTLSNCNGIKSQGMKVADSDSQTKDVVSDGDNRHGTDGPCPEVVSLEGDESSRGNILPISTSKQSQNDEVEKEHDIRSDLDRKHDLNMETNDSEQPTFEVLAGSSIPVDNEGTQLAEHAPLLPANSDLLFGHQAIVQSGFINEAQVYNQQVEAIKNEISHMQDSIASIELQLWKVSLRRDFLGRDTAGRLYWALSRPGKSPWLVVDGKMPVQENRSGVKEQGYPSGSKTSLSSRAHKDSSTFGFGSSFYGSLDLCPWVSYDSDGEIQDLVGWLSSNDPRERELKESISQMQKFKCQDIQQARSHSNDDCEVTRPKSCCENVVAPISIATKAFSILEERYGPCLELETTDIPKKRGRKTKVTQEVKMYRCECLEPVWPSRYHCLSCHQTFCTNVELEGHNDGKCNSVPPAPDDAKDTDDQLKGKGKMRIESTREESTDEMDVDESSKSGKLDISSKVIKMQNGPACPFNFEEICKKFITRDSNRELVQGIGFIGSNGVPSLVPSDSPYIHDPTLILESTLKDKLDGGVELVSPQQSRVAANFIADYNSNDLLKRFENESKAKGQTSECLNNKGAAYLNKKVAELEIGGNCCVVPVSSLRPLVGKVSQILRRLKTNLLDMDAALPEEALRPSKAHSPKRCAWRAFVKSAESIFEMVQATIVFQEMIKTEYLKNVWWYWSSFSAAAKTPTVSSLALRIYALDANILYQKTLSGSDTSPTENPKLGKRKKDAEG